MTEERNQSTRRAWGRFADGANIPGAHRLFPDSALVPVGRGRNKTEDAPFDPEQGEKSKQTPPEC